MKNTAAGSLIVLLIGVMILGINAFAIPLSDWIIRATGAVLLINITIFSYCTVKLSKSKR